MSGPRFQLFLVRHGLTDWNLEGRLLGRIGIGLNLRGRLQAEAASEALAPFSAAAVVSSPQPRAVETAEPIAAAGGLSLRLDEAFDEVWLDEAWQGKTVEELRGDPELERFLGNPTFRGRRIEPIEEVQGRAVAGVERLREEFPEDSVVVVSHGDPLRAILSQYLGLPLPDLRRLAVDNGSVSCLRFSRRGAQLVRLNWTPSLSSR